MKNRLFLSKDLGLQQMQESIDCSKKQQDQQAYQGQQLHSQHYAIPYMDDPLQPLTYKITQIDLMIEDVNKRYEIISTSCSMLEQRVKLEYEYAEKLKAIYTNCSLVNTITQKPKSPAEFFFITLVNILSKQSSNHEKLAQQLHEEVYKNLKEETTTLQTENKKNLTLAKSIKKELDSDQEQLEKCKHKFCKKSSQLQKLKIDYINATLLQDRDFERKNKLFLKIKELENEVQPLKKSYESISGKYSDTLSTSLTKFSELCKKIQQKQISAVKATKNSLINSQLFSSALGAILVHETQAILSYLDPIKIQTVQLSVHSSKQIEEEKSFYQNPFQNPSEYIDQSFKKIETNSIEELILYGKNPEYKRELGYYFDNSHCFEDFSNLKVINCYTVRIIEIFKSVFQGKDYSSSQLIEFGQLIKTKPSLRKDFIFCLQKYRLDGKFNITKENFHNIIELLNIFLNICALELDTYNSKQFMVLSFTYHFVNEEGEKTDLQAYVKEHKIWKNIKWWESGLLESIYEEHKVKKKKPQINPTFSLWDIKSSSLKKIDPLQDNSTIVNICFNQLAYYLHNMQLFGLNSADIDALASKYIKTFCLSAKMANDIQVMCLSSKQDSSPQRGDKNN